MTSFDGKNSSFLHIFANYYIFRQIDGNLLSGWHWFLASIFSLCREKTDAKFWCQNLMPSRWANFASIWRIFTPLSIILTKFFAKTLFLLHYASFWRIFWQIFKVEIFNALFWCHTMYVKTVFANIFHKECYKIIKIPYGPLCSIKNTIY